MFLPSFYLQSSQCRGILCIDGRWKFRVWNIKRRGRAECFEDSFWRKGRKTRCHQHGHNYHSTRKPRGISSHQNGCYGTQGWSEVLFYHTLMACAEIYCHLMTPSEFLKNGIKFVFEMWAKKSLVRWVYDCISVLVWIVQGRFKNVYELVNSRALKISMLHKTISFIHFWLACRLLTAVCVWANIFSGCQLILLCIHVFM